MSCISVFIATEQFKRPVRNGRMFMGDVELDTSSLIILNIKL